MKMKMVSFKLILFTLGLPVLHLISGPEAHAEKIPPLPQGPPEIRRDKGALQKASETLQKDCRQWVEHQLGKTQTTQGTRHSRTFCLCVVKDVQRRGDLEEMKFLRRYYQNQIANETKLTDVQSLHLHEIEKTEENCRIDPSYRFGQPEPRLRSESETAEGKKPVAAP